MTYQKIKSNINKYIENGENLFSSRKLGGPGIKIQVDETIIAHGELPLCPSRIKDGYPGI